MYILKAHINQIHKIIVKVQTIAQVKDLYCSVVCVHYFCAQEDTLLYRVLFFF